MDEEVAICERSKKAILFEEAVRKFNRYRSPEAKAEILEISKDRALVKITGVFRFSCCVFDYFEDIAIEAKAKVVDYREVEDGFIVSYHF